MDEEAGNLLQVANREVIDDAFEIVEMKTVSKPVGVRDEAESGDQGESQRRAVSSDERLHEKKNS
jgi:hypothetical protein